MIQPNDITTPAEHAAIEDALRLADVGTAKYPKVLAAEVRRLAERATELERERGQALLEIQRLGVMVAKKGHRAEQLERERRALQEQVSGLRCDSCRSPMACGRTVRPLCQLRAERLETALREAQEYITARFEREEMTEVAVRNQREYEARRATLDGGTATPKPNEHATPNDPHGTFGAPGMMGG